MRITENRLRLLIREVLVESLTYDTSEKEMIDGVIDDYFNVKKEDGNGVAVVDRQVTRNRYESAYELTSRWMGPDLSNEIKALGKIFNSISIEVLFRKKLQDFEAETSVMKRLRFLKDLSEDEVKSVVKGLEFLFPDYVKLGYERYSSDEERVRKVKLKNKVIEDKKRILGELSNKILNRLSDAGKYEDTRNMTKYAVLTLQKLSEMPLELGIA